MEAEEEEAEGGGVLLLVVQGCSSSCGEIGNIRYPFRLKGDPAECGDTEYELVCRGNKTILEILSVEYYVTNISYENYQPSVVGTEWASGGVCALPSRSVSSISNPYDEYTYFNWVSFVNCSEEIHGHGYRRYIPLPCLNRNSSNGFVYVTYAYLVGDLEVSCIYLSTVAVTRSSSEESSLTDDIFQKLHMGMVLTWKKKDMSVAEMLLGCRQEVMDAEKSIGNGGKIVGPTVYLCVLVPPILEDETAYRQNREISTTPKDPLTNKVFIL